MNQDKLYGVEDSVLAKKVDRVDHSKHTTFLGAIWQQKQYSKKA